MPVSLRDAFTPTGLNVTPDLSYDDWHALGEAIGGMSRATPWMIGDWWALGEARFGETAAQAAEAVNLNRQSLLNYGSVARRIPPQDRRPELSWYAHSLVAPLPRAERNRLLDRAVREGWDSGRVKGALAASRAGVASRDNGERPSITPEEALKLVRADPVWTEIATRALDHPPDVVRCPACGHQWEQPSAG